MHEELVRYVEQRRSEMVELLEQLVNMDSYSTDKEENDRCGVFLAGKLQPLGVGMSSIRYEECGDLLIGSWNKGAPKRVLLVGHRDTVFPSGTVAARPFTRKGDMCYGPGVGDMKGGLVVALYALKAVHDLGLVKDMQIDYVCNGDEEIKSTYSLKDIAELARGCAAVLVFEGSGPNGEVTTSRRGGGKLQIEVLGKPVHSGGNVAEGISASEELAQKIIRIHALANREIGTNTNVGVFGGGTHYNIVTEKAWAGIDLRFATEEEHERLISEIESIVETSYVQGTKSNLEVVSIRPCVERTAGIAALYERIRRVGRSLGQEIGERFGGGGSDQNECAAVGVPAIDGFGPSGGNAHTVDEFMRIPTMFSRAVLAAAVLESLDKEE